MVHLAINEKMSQGDIELLNLLIKQYGYLGYVSKKIPWKSPKVASSDTDSPMVYRVAKKDGSSVDVTIDRSLIPFSDNTFMATIPKQIIAHGGFGAVRRLPYFITEKDDGTLEIQTAIGEWSISRMLTSGKIAKKNTFYLDVSNDKKRLIVKYINREGIIEGKILDKKIFPKGMENIFDNWSNTTVFTDAKDARRMVDVLMSFVPVEWVMKKQMLASQQRERDIETQRINNEIGITRAMFGGVDVPELQRQRSVVMVMPLIRGESIRVFINEKKLTLNEVLSIGKAMLTELGNMEDLGIVHRDIKPENMMYDRGLHVYKMMDYGVSVGKGTVDTVNIADTCYTAPENKGAVSPFNHASDIYAAGISLFYMLLSSLPDKKDTVITEFINAADSHDFNKLIAVIKNAFDILKKNQATSAQYIASKDFWQAALTMISEKPEGRINQKEILKYFPGSLLADDLIIAFSAISDNISSVMEPASVQDTANAVSSAVNQLQQDVQALHGKVDGKTLSALQTVVHGALKAIPEDALIAAAPVPAPLFPLTKVVAVQDALDKAKQAILVSPIVASSTVADLVDEAAVTTLISSLANINNLIKQLEQGAKQVSEDLLSFKKDMYGLIVGGITASNSADVWEKFINILVSYQSSFHFFPRNVINVLDTIINSEHRPLTTYNNSTVGKTLSQVQFLLELVSQVVTNNFLGDGGAGIKDLNERIELSNVTLMDIMTAADRGLNTMKGRRFFQYLEVIPPSAIETTLNNVEDVICDENLPVGHKLLTEILIRNLESNRPKEAAIQWCVDNGADLSIEKNGKCVWDLAMQNESLSQYWKNIFKGIQRKYQEKAKASVGKKAGQFLESDIGKMFHSSAGTQQRHGLVFQSKVEAYSYVLCYLRRLFQGTNNNNEKAAINTVIEQIKTAMENHQQDITVVTDVLSALAKNTSRANGLTTLVNAISSNSFKQTAQQKFENPLARRFESQIAIGLLQKPTSAMMKAVGRISQEILRVIDTLSEKEKQNYLDSLKETNHAIAFGAASYSKIEDVKEILQNNDPTQSIKIMFMHFKFAQNILREVNVTTVSRRKEKPVGALNDIVCAQAGGNNSDLCAKFFDSTPDNKNAGFVADKVIYNSPLYASAGGGRGRQGALKDERQNKMGLLLATQSEYDKDLPQENSAKWVADAKSQDPDLTSPYVTDLINQDAVYVSGPSGMASLLLGQMESLGNFETEDLKQNYLLAVMAYIAGGGFHSIHEIIGPAQYSLKLVPGYNVSVPSKNTVAEAPNFHKFFEQQSKIDSGFAARYNAAWDSYLNFFESTYLAKTPSLRDSFNSLTGGLNPPSSSSSSTTSTTPISDNTDKQSVLHFFEADEDGIPEGEEI